MKNRCFLLCVVAALAAVLGVVACRGESDGATPASPGNSETVSGAPDATQPSTPTEGTPVNVVRLAGLNNTVKIDITELVLEPRSAAEGPYALRRAITDPQTIFAGAANAGSALR